MMKNNNYFSGHNLLVNVFIGIPSAQCSRVTNSVR